MKKLEFKEMEIVLGGDDEDDKTCIGKAAGLMVAGMTIAFTPLGASLVLGGALYGYFAC